MAENPLESVIVDFAIVLHSFSSQLDNVVEWLEPISLFNDNPFSGRTDLTGVDLEGALLDPVRSLVALLTDRIAEQTTPEHVALRAQLEATQTPFERYLSSSSGKRARAPYLHERLRELEALVVESDNTENARPGFGQILKVIKRIRRILFYYDLNGAVEVLGTLKQQALALREYWVNSEKTKDPFQTISLNTIVETAVRQTANFAAYRGIEIRTHGILTVRLKARKAELTQAVYNILHNAVKYNYLLSNEAVWVDIRTSHRHGWITVEIENWGVPITQDELASGRIFHPGVRGTYASLSGKQGNGIGLAEAKRIVVEHGGRITLASKPAGKNDSQSDYTKPFMTTVTLQFPEIRE